MELGLPSNQLPRVSISVRIVSGVRVYSQHTTRGIIPNAEDENHSATESLAHTSHGTLGLELVGAAICVIHGVDGGLTWNVDLGVLDDLSILNIDSADLLEMTRGLVVVGYELSDNSELLAGINSVVGAHTEEVLSTILVAVETASVLVAHTFIAVGSSSAEETLALIETGGVARMRSESCGFPVGFPEIHLLTACAVGIVDVGNTVDPGLDGALGVAVSGSVRGAGGIEFGFAAICQHFRQAVLGQMLLRDQEERFLLESTIDLAANLGHINIEGNLLVQETHHVILVPLLVQ